MSRNKDQIILDLNKQLELIKQENLLLKKLNTTAGFFEHFYSLLPNCNTNKEAFVKANEDYYNLFKKYKYSSIESFYKTQTRRSK